MSLMQGIYLYMSTPLGITIHEQFNYVERQMERTQIHNL
jgi:hypothetical protein